MDVRDPIYAFEIARRSVGRAALHLGITTMTESTLDVLADVLLQYLSRTGKAMAHLVESSNRTSAHANVLDALQACQAVASPAVQRLHLAPDVEDSQQILLMGASGSAAAAVAKGGSGTGGAASAAAAAAKAATTAGGGGGSSDPTGKSGGRLLSATGTGSGTAVAGAFGQDSSTDWRGLAAFCFGPKWLEEKDEADDIPLPPPAQDATATPNDNDGNRMEIDGEEEDNENGDAAVARPGAGKVGPSAAAVTAAGGGDMDRVGRLLNTKKRGNKGWDAPYLDEVKAFPRASKNCANPHALPARVRLSLHYRKTDIDAEEAEEEEEAALAELDGIPDNVFVSANLKASGIEPDAAKDVTWGSMNKRKAGHDDNDDDDEDEGTGPPTKRVRLNDGNALRRASSAGRSKIGAETTKDDDGNMPTEFAYVPSFYPLPPSTKKVVDLGRTVVDTRAEQQKLLLQQQQETFFNPVASSSAVLDVPEASQDVRSSLVNMGQFYWGSGWDASTKPVDAEAGGKVVVPMGRPTSIGDGASVRPEEYIAPMSRASQSRVSRILEGSMDAAAMQ